MFRLRLVCCNQVLSLSNNRLEEIHGVTSLRSLRILRVDRNRIVRLPASLMSLRDLTVLDVSHNRLEAVPPPLADLAARLYRYSLSFLSACVAFWLSGNGGRDVNEVLLLRARV